MYKATLANLMIFCCASASAAQSNAAPRVEVFGGYSVLKTKYHVERRDDDPVLTFFLGKQTLHGFNTAATGYLKGGFGLTGDFSAHFTTERALGTGRGSIDNHIRVFDILGGPQYKFRNNSRVMPFVRVMAGVAHTRGRLDVRLPTQNSTETKSSSAFALAMGGGVDVRAGAHFDLRIIQVDYNPIFLSRGNELGFGKSRADNFRFSFGIVFK